MKRMGYHLRVMGRDALWIRLAAAVGFVGLAAGGGELIRTPAGLALWSELALPAGAAVLAGFACSPCQDELRPVVSVCRRGAWRTYLERAGLLLGVDVLLSLGAGLAFWALALPGESPLLALSTAAAGLPVLVLFTFLALLAGEAGGSGPGGAAAALAVWLFFLLNPNLAGAAGWELVYPFQVYVSGWTAGLVWNRAVLAGLGLAAALAYAWRLRRGPG